jgi:hypothetical protein
MVVQKFFSIASEVKLTERATLTSIVCTHTNIIDRGLFLYSVLNVSINMATNVVINDESITNDDYLEIFSLVWFDTNINIEDNRGTQQKLRSIINHINKFEDVQQCEKYIKQRSKKDRIVLVVNGQLGKELVSSIHNLRQVSSIYVYCMDKKNNEEWSNKFNKVK